MPYFWRQKKQILLRDKLSKCPEDLDKKEKEYESFIVTRCKSTWQKGDIIEVSDGYAKNFLIKKKMAIQATNQVINETNQKKASELRKLEIEKQEAKSKGGVPCKVCGG